MYSVTTEGRKKAENVYSSKTFSSVTDATPDSNGIRKFCEGGVKSFLKTSNANHRRNSETTTQTAVNSGQRKQKETFREFLARTKRQAQDMDAKNQDGEFVRDDYAKASSCRELVRKQTGVIYDDKMMLHKCPWDTNYPENPNRYRVVLERCRQLGLIERCHYLSYSPATVEQITTLHTEEIFKKLSLISSKNSIDEQEKYASNYDAIYFNKETFDAALISAGCVTSLVRAVCEGVVQNGMAIVRPPGHHAMNNEFCGYCYFNNVALAAKYALDNDLAKKILIVDYDVHHGQATQRMFYEDNRVVYFSIHRYEHGTFWPNLRESEYDYIGKGKGTGYNINFPLNKIGLGDAEYLSVVTHILLPVAYEYQPDLIIVSAGYDACVGCPEGRMTVSPGFYGHLINLLSGLAGGKVAVCLEGGYFLPSLAEGAAMTLKSLLGDPSALLSPLDAPHPTVIETINNLKIVLNEYWECFRMHQLFEAAEQKDCHAAVVTYKGEPGTPPYRTRDCYPLQTKEHVEKYSKIVAAYKNEYDTLGSNQKVCYSYDEGMLLHKSKNDSYVETPARLSETIAQFKQWQLDTRCRKVESKPADAAVLKRVHKEHYVNKIMNQKYDEIIGRPRGDMFYNEETTNAVLKSCGCLLSVVESVVKGAYRSGVALIRPPGHHADKDTSSGFCYVNNVAVAAQHILDNYDIKRILIVDFDVHHGNGTQNLFYEDDRVLYISIHRYEDGKYYPFSTDGSYDKCGRGKGEGYNVNIAMNKERLSNADYITIFHRIVLPVAYSYAPQLVLVSAGFDAGINDKLGNYAVTPDCFGHFVQMLKPLANGKLILALEGGYNPLTVKYSMNICIKTLLGDPLPILEVDKVKSGCFKTLDNIISLQKKYWPVLDVDRKLAGTLP